MLHITYVLYMHLFMLIRDTGNEQQFSDAVIM